MSSRRQDKRQPKPKKAAGKRTPGRPSRYRAEFAEQAGKLCRLGATDQKMAEFFGVDVATLNRWKLRHAGFCESLKRGGIFRQCRGGGPALQAGAGLQPFYFTEPRAEAPGNRNPITSLRRP